MTEIEDQDRTDVYQTAIFTSLSDDVKMTVEKAPTEEKGIHLQ
jgi:hypothetical protein